MVKKKFFVFPFLVTALQTFPQLSASSQTKEFKHIMKEANTLFEKDDFKKAEQKYLSVYRLDSTNEALNLNLAICRYKLKEFPDSILPYLLKADKSKLPEAQFYEAKIYHLEHKFTEAVAHYEKYKTFPKEKRDVKNAEVDRLISISNRAKEFLSRPHHAVITNEGSAINTGYPEYGPLISGDESVMYFTSRRPGSTGNIKDAWSNYYEDVYVSYRRNGEWSRAENVGAPINTNTHDACVALSADGQQLIIYRTSADGLSGDLYLSQFVKGLWGTPEKLGSQINTEYKELSACFSPDNNSIVFSSDKPGGFGGKDLYKVVKLPNGQWSLPTNLGNEINTPFDEDAPFISTDGTTLYFSSKGHENIGEYDIFKSAIDEHGSFAKPENMNFPVNTVGDDIFFVLSANEKHGYYSSLNENPAEIGYESEDIYFIDMRYTENDIKVKRGVTVLNTEALTPVGAKITVIDMETNKVVGIYNSSQNTGYFILAVNPYCNYKLLAECKECESATLEMAPLIKQQDVDEENTFKIILKPKQ